MINKLSNNKLLVSILYCLPFLLMIDSWQRMSLFIAGVFFGAILLIVDEEYLSKYYAEKSQQNDQFVDNALISRSTLFLLLLVPLSFFIVSSTSGTLGKGFVLGIVLGLVQEMWLLKKNVTLFQKRFLSQLKKSLDSSQTELLIIIATIYFLLISVWSALMK